MTSQASSVSERRPEGTSRSGGLQHRDIDLVSRRAKLSVAVQGNGGPVAEEESVFPFVIAGIVGAGVISVGLHLLFSEWFGTGIGGSALLIILTVGAIVGAAEAEPRLAALLAVLALVASVLGLARSLGWPVTIAIIAFCAIAIAAVVLGSDGGGGAGTAPPSASPNAARRAPTPGGQRDSSASRRDRRTRKKPTSEAQLDRFVRDQLWRDKDQDIMVAVQAIRQRLDDESFMLERDQTIGDLVRRHQERASQPEQQSGARPAARKQPEPERKKAGGRTHIHEFGSFEIDRAVESCLAEDPALDDWTNIARVQEALGVADQSMFAINRMHDSIARVRVRVPRPESSSEEGSSEAARIAVTPRRQDGRRYVYEYGSHELERAVENILKKRPAADSGQVTQAILELLGVDDWSALALERIHGAIARVQANRRATSPSKRTKSATAAAKPKKTQPARKPKPAPTPEPKSAPKPKPILDEAPMLVEARLTIQTMDEPIPVEVLWELVEPGVGRAAFERALDRSGGFVFDSDGLVTIREQESRSAGASSSAKAASSQSLSDAAHDHLLSVGRPVDFDDIHAAVSRGRNASSLKNVLSADDRIIRTDRTEYGLTAWGLEPYDSIIGLITRHLERAGGAADLTDIIDDLTSRFTVDARSIRVSTNSDHFVTVDRGRIRLRAVGEVPEEDLPEVSEVRGCFVDGGRWRIRITVDEKLLRGFSTPLPKGFALRLGVLPLESRDFSTDLGEPVSVNRKAKTDAIGRLRTLAEGLGLEPGDHLIVREPQRRRGALAIDALRAEDLAAIESPAGRAAALMGMELLEDASAAAKAIGLRKDASPASIAGALLMRGDEELAGLILEAFEDEDGPAAPNVKDIAELLGL